MRFAKWADGYGPPIRIDQNSEESVPIIKVLYHPYDWICIAEGTDILINYTYFTKSEATETTVLHGSQHRLRSLMAMLRVSNMCKIPLVLCSNPDLDLGTPTCFSDVEKNT